MMNLLEIYVKEIHSEEKVQYKGMDIVKVDITTNCYGDVKRTVRSFLSDEWEAIKKTGYYMG